MKILVNYVKHKIGHDFNAIETNVQDLLFSIFKFVYFFLYNIVFFEQKLITNKRRQDYYDGAQWKMVKVFELLIGFKRS